jgi:hypothetical protein
MNQAEQIQSLLTRIAALEQQQKQLQHSFSIPRNVEAALTSRLPFVSIVGTSTATTTSTSSFPVVVPLVTGVVEAQVGNKTYKLLYQ